MRRPTPAGAFDRPSVRSLPAPSFHYHHDQTDDGDDERKCQDERAGDDPQHRLLPARAPVGQDRQQERDEQDAAAEQHPDEPQDQRHEPYFSHPSPPLVPPPRHSFLPASRSTLGVHSPSASI